MKKVSKLLIGLASILALCSCANQEIITPVEKDPQVFTVRFMDNLESYGKTPYNMDSSAYSKMVYKVEVTENNPVSEPSIELTPVAGYKFDGWYKEIECKNRYDFSTLVTSNLSLYAGYVRDETQVVIEEYVEPKLEFVDKVDDSIYRDLLLTSILNMPIYNNTVDMSTYGLRVLENKKNDCLSCLNYTRKSTISNLQAKFENNTVVITYVSSSNTNVTLNIKVNHVSYTLGSNFENKALKYEKIDMEEYSIILGGSSSMENWATSTLDLKGITSYNIGMGGSKVEDWDELANARLVYPANPRGVVYYLGINNIINGSDNGITVGNSLVSMFEHVHEHLPNTTIYFILINYVPGYMQYASEIETANNIVKEFSLDKEYMVLIDAGSLLMKPNGQPSWSYFRTDGLHMSLAGYVLWGGEVKRVIIEHETKIYGENNG